jgi:hypothetical protein
MEVGFSSHIWTIEEVMKLLEGRSILDGIFQAA